MGFLGILEDKHLAHVPATVTLNEEQDVQVHVTEGLKRGTGRDADIILIPQPYVFEKFIHRDTNKTLTILRSEDPNDPLNWSFTKKITIITIVSYGSILYAAVLSPLLSPALVLIALDYNKKISDITVISGYMLLVTGGVGPLVSALSRKYGKRPQLLIASLFGLLGTIICSAVDSYEGLTAGRIIQGGSVYVRF